MLEIIVYSTAVCPYCINAKNLLEAKKVQYVEIKVDEDKAKLEEMISKTGRRTVPQIFIGDKHIGGFDDLNALHQTGELDRLLV